MHFLGVFFCVRLGGIRSHWRVSISGRVYYISLCQGIDMGWEGKVLVPWQEESIIRYNVTVMLTWEQVMIV